MAKQLIISLRMTFIFLIIVCAAYPALVFGISQLLFSNQANGSLVRNAQGQVVGSSLIGQSFVKPEYFQPRPSAAGSGYDSTASGGTNLGPTSDKLINGVKGFDGVKQLATEYRKSNGLKADAEVPVDAVTRSASGLDPDISIQNADLQANRIAHARGITSQDVLKLIDDQTTAPQLGILGVRRVNVLQLNMALDSQYPVKAAVKQ